jgi:hypothetical protein
MGAPTAFDLVSALALGIALAAACGFRVFVPPLVLSLAALWGHLALSPGLTFLGTWPAAVTLAVATVLEIVAYYVPWLDHLLDHLGAPLAAAAGVLMLASTLGDLPPHFRWALAVVAGGGAAASVHVATAALRAVVGLATAGLGNFLVATAEAVLAVLLAVLAVLAPFLAVAFLALLVALAARVWRRRRATRAAT